MIHTAVLIVFIVIAPYFLQLVSARWQPFKFMGATIACFIAGMVFGNFFPAFEGREAISKSLSEAIVPPGICLMLFCTDIRRWLGVSLRMLFSYAIGAASVLIMAVTAFLLLGRTIPLPAFVSAMLTGAYVGGTPNMSAIQLALGIDDDLFMKVFLSDVAASSIYLVFIMVVAQPLLVLFLKAYRPVRTAVSHEDGSASFRQLPLSKKCLYIVAGLLLAATVTAVPLGLWMLVYGDERPPDMAFVMIALTLGSVGLSFIPSVRKLPGAYETGDYLFCMFFLLLGTMTDFGAVIGMDGAMFVYTLLILFGAVLLHILLAKLFRIDADTLIVTSAAGIMSPPFIPAVSSAIRNRELLVPGMAVAIIGLAAGNILGIFIGKLLLAW